MTNDQYRQQATIAAMQGIMAGTRQIKITPTHIATEAHDIAEAMLDEEIRRHGGNDKPNDDLGSLVASTKDMFKVKRTRKDDA